MTHPRVLVVVITYNGEHWIRHCLGSLQQSKLPVSVLVVDNQSTDDTVMIIKKDFPEVQLIESSENLGFGRGNNVGMKKALDENYDYAFLLNQDAWIDPDTVETLIEVHQKYPEYGIISPLHLNRTETKLDRNFANYLCQANNLELMSDLLVPNSATQDIYTVGFVNAAAWFLSQERLQAVGGFDPLFPHYGEDQDYVQRVVYYGYKVGVTPRTKIIHDREGYTKQSQMHRTLAIQYNGSLILLKNVNRPLHTNVLVVLKNEVFEALAALLTRDTEQFVIKMKLLRKLMLQYFTIRRHRKYCATRERVFLT